jgi:hypothetical protein
MQSDKSRPVFLLISLLITVLMLILSGCDWTNPDQSETEIRNIVYDVEHDFNWNDIDGIMEHVHPDYLHNGMHSMQLRNAWLNRKADYDLLSCDVDSVLIQGDYATVYMTLTFQNSHGNYAYHEPESFGDISYFYYDQDSWRIYGNQGEKANKHTETAIQVLMRHKKKSTLL